MQTPVRKIVNGSRQKIIGRFYSRKMKSHIPYECVPERNYFYWLEFDKTVAAYYCQPVTIEFLMDEKLHRYTPDVELRLWQEGSRPVFVDVKPDGVADYKDTARKLAVITEAFDELDADFSTVAAEWAEASPRLENLKLLYSHADHHAPSAARALCQDAISAPGGIRLKELADRLLAAGYPIPVLYSLMFEGAVGFNLDAPINWDAVLTLPQGGAQ
ncbi:MAG: hypothetical protein ACLPXB_06425 [Thiobacillaceae bacterium]